MKTTLKHRLMRLAKAALTRMEDSYRIDPVTSRQTRWYDEALSIHRPFPEEVGGNGRDAHRMAWREGEPVRQPGLCEVDDSIIWVMRPSRARLRYEQERKALIFTAGYRPIKCPGLPHAWVFFLSHDWRGWRKMIREMRVLPGRIGILGNFGFDTRNYYHFWADTIADLWYLRQHLAASRLPERYLVHFAGLPWQWEILEMCGVSRGQVIPMLDHEFLRAGTAVVPVRDKGAEVVPPWLAEAIRQVAGWQPRAPATRRLLYISRADAPRRRVVNEEEVCDRLREAGFEVLTLNGMTVRQQQALFASASVICTPHGAALTNLVWCHPGTLVVDFLPEGYLVPCFRELSRQSGVRYHPVMCKESPGSGRRFEADIFIPMVEVDALCRDAASEALSRHQDDGMPIPSVNYGS